MAQVLSIPEDSALEETFLEKEFLLLFAAMDLETKVSMLHVFTNAAFRKLLKLRQLALQDRLINLHLVEKDPTTFHHKFAIIRVELGLVEDVGQFMNSGLEQLKQDFPEMFAGKAEDISE